MDVEKMGVPVLFGVLGGMFCEDLALGGRKVRLRVWLFSSRALKEGEGCDDRQSKEPTAGVFAQSRTRIAASQ